MFIYLGPNKILLKLVQICYDLKIALYMIIYIKILPTLFYESFINTNLLIILYLILTAKNFFLCKNTNKVYDDNQF